jgi:hypothetical protein
MRRRLIELPFPVGHDEDTADESIKRYLLTEPSARRAWLAWAVEGLRRLTQEKKRKLTKPAEVKASTDEYWNEQDSLGPFVRTLALDPDGFIISRKLNDEFDAWVWESGLKLTRADLTRCASIQTLLDAIKSREAEKRELLAQLEHLDGLAKAAASYDSAAHLAAWKIILPDWSKALTAEGPAGRQRLRRLLRGPVYVFRGTDGVWRFEGHGTLGGVFKGWLGLQIMDEELDDMNAEADRLNAGSAFGPDDSLKNVPALEAEGAASTFGPQPMESAGLEPASAQVHYQWCPRHGT